MSIAVQRENRILALKLALMVPVMLAFCATMVPLYKVICEQLGISQTRAVATGQNSQVDFSRSVTVEFLANRNQNFGWQFAPVERSVTVHPGELKTIRYRVTNLYDRSTTGRAVPSFSPMAAGRSFEKLECFCFSNQTLGPGETREMPVVFRVLPGLDREIGTVSLSYTFFDVTGKAGDATQAEARKEDAKS